MRVYHQAAVIGIFQTPRNNFAGSVSVLTERKHEGFSAQKLQGREVPLLSPEKKSLTR